MGRQIAGVTSAEGWCAVVTDADVGEGKDAAAAALAAPYQWGYTVP